MIKRGSIVKRYGGKGATAQHLIPRFARADWYVEPFFGAGSVFFALPLAAYQFYAVNDRDSDVVNFFRILRDKPDVLQALVELSPHARDELVAAREPTDDPVEKARRFWCRSRMGFAGIDLPTSGYGRDTLSGYGKIDQLREYARALVRVTEIDNADAIDFLSGYGTQAQCKAHKVFIYADPPYVLSTRKGVGYAHEMTDEHHRALAAKLREIVSYGGRVAVSGYDSDLYNELYAGWRTVRFDTALLAGKQLAGKQRGTRTEVLWLSYDESEEMGAYAPRVRPKSSLEAALLASARGRR